MGEPFDLISKHLERLLSYPNWLPSERCGILFYLDKFRNELIPPGMFCVDEFGFDSALKAMLNVDDIGSLVTDILEQRNKSWTGQDFGPPNLSHLKARLQLLLPRSSSVLRVNKEYSEAYKLKIEGEICVGFDGEARNLLDLLTAITLKRLEVISIVGMAGLGKTTLAKKVYDDPLIVYHFYVRAWVSVSQVYQKKDMLLGILSSFMELSDDVWKMSANCLAEMLYRSLKGKRYLIVVDDIWNIEAWEGIRKSFPSDNNGSRIMLTTRLRDVALHAQPEKSPHFLRFLTEEESWELFQSKVFPSGLCSDMGLKMIGKEITRKCHGLPLAIVVLAGLLKNNLKIEWWRQVCKYVSSYIVSDPKQFMDTLALSYNNLPQHLKACFLYFGAFSEDYEIPVRKLIWLWIAEGFICQIGTKSLEDVAEDYLMDLLKRSLIVVATKGSDGGIKTCRMHDLLRDLCLLISEEDKFSPKIYRYTKHSYSCTHCLLSSSSDPPTNSLLGLSIDVLDISSKCTASSVNALTCSAPEFFESISKEISMIWESSKLLRALDLSSVQLCIFPGELLQLVNLRYLEVKFTYGSPPESVSDLIFLETLIISSRSGIIIPENMWKMVNMRHLYIRSGENLVKYSSFEEVPDLLENLQTMSQVSPSRSCEYILARTPNLRKLGLCGPLVSKLGDLKLPDLGLLNHLETLKLLNTAPISGPGGARPCNPIFFPERLKRLTMSCTNLEWKEAWIFEMLPNLEVLKLKMHAFVGQEWETCDGVFRRLKFLRIEEMDIVNWRASGNHFPMLQRLVVHRCPNLNEIPSGFGYISTLEWIEISGCSHSATNSARDIQKEKENNGNDWLKIRIIPTVSSSLRNTVSSSLRNRRIKIVPTINRASLWNSAGILSEVI